MSNFRDRVNAHLPIVLQLLSTLSLVVIALTAICGSQSLKKLAGSHEVGTNHGESAHMLHNHK
tara:strand:+ start:387 stop:575 length:189 start_codon:yes stop_codon:yes gene_type:complete